MDAPWIDGPPDWPNIRTADDLRQFIGYYGEEAVELYDIRLVECDPCEGSGRHMVYHNPSQGEASPCNERDVGVCPHCSGRGIVEMKTEPVECDDEPHN